MRSPSEFCSEVFPSRGGLEHQPLLRRQEYAFPLKFTPAVMKHCVYSKREESISLPRHCITRDFRSQSETARPSHEACRLSSPGIAVRRTASLRSPMTGRSSTRCRRDQQRVLQVTGCPAFAGHDSAWVGPHALTFPVRSASTRSSWRDSLPTVVFGKSSRNSSADGNSCLPILPARKSRSSSSENFSAPARSLT